MTLLVHGYASKKELRVAIGEPLNFEETSIFGKEYKRNGSFVVVHRPALSGGKGREFFARITMQDGLIARVE